MRLKESDRARSLASSPTTTPIKLVPNRSLLWRVRGYQTASNNFIKFKCTVVFKQQTNTFNK
ncbi:hypothetical protein HMPREF1415_00491 [Helicobacter pylori GAM254Ai]|nr:hypothetical protein HMPREF1415_00491 [Helicobacter pylori GAM254Ai]